jgi:uncharacterized protein YfiM (DUF2279 family)
LDDFAGNYAIFTGCGVLILSHTGEMKMRHFTASLIVAACIGILPAAAGAKGCVKGAVVGGVVGHVAGHHAVLGAAAGCVIEHHREKEKAKAAHPAAPSQNGAPAKEAAQSV